MDIKNLKESILSNNIPNLMIFIGQEQYLIKQYIIQMSSTLNKYYKYYDNADDVLVETSTNFKDDYLYIILNDDKILKNINYIEELKKTNRTIIIYFTDFDTKCDLYKQYKDLFINFKYLDKYTILAYLMKQLKNNKIEVDQSKINTLIDMCECDLGKCMNELEKVICLEQASSNILVDYMMNCGFSDYRKLNIFSFVQKILNKDISVFNDRFKISDPTLNVLSLLYNQAKLRLTKTNNVAYADIMQSIAELDLGIKDGTINSSSALDYLLLKVM